MPTTERAGDRADRKSEHHWSEKVEAAHVEAVPTSTLTLHGRHAPHQDTTKEAGPRTNECTPKS